VALLPYILTNFFTCIVAQTNDPLESLAHARNAHQTKDFASCATGYSDVAIALPGAPSPLYRAACCHAMIGHIDLAFEFLNKALDADWHDVDELKGEEDLEALRCDPRWTTVLKRSEEAAVRFQKSCNAENLRGELLNRMKEDQRVRLDPPKLWEFGKLADWRRIDSENTSFMKAVIDKCGWPEKSLVGEVGSLAAFVLVQHAENVPFQTKCLSLLTDAVDRGEARPQDRAYLLDRVLVREGKPQRYGTQFQGTGLDLKPYPIDDEANVDARRREIGLPPMAEYAKQLQEITPH